MDHLLLCNRYSRPLCVSPHTPEHVLLSEAQRRQWHSSIHVSRDADLSPAFCIGCTRDLQGGEDRRLSRQGDHRMRATASPMLRPKPLALPVTNQTFGMKFPSLLPRCTTTA